MERNERAAEVLNDLVRINNDRITGYEKSLSKADEKDADLRNIFSRIGQESRNYTRELVDQIHRLGGEPASGTTAAGKIYRTWMNVKSGFSNSERKSILEECEFGEDAAQKACEKALAPENNLPGEIRALVQKEKNNLKRSHDAIKSYRDMQRPSNK